MSTLKECQTRTFWGKWDSRSFIASGLVGSFSRRPKVSMLYPESQSGLGLEKLDFPLCTLPSEAKSNNAAALGSQEPPR